MLFYRRKRKRSVNFLNTLFVFTFYRTTLLQRGIMFCGSSLSIRSSYSCIAHKRININHSRISQSPNTSPIVLLFTH